MQPADQATAPVTHTELTHRISAMILDNQPCISPLLSLCRPWHSADPFKKERNSVDAWPQQNWSPGCTVLGNLTDTSATACHAHMRRTCTSAYSGQRFSHRNDDVVQAHTHEYASAAEDRVLGCPVHYQHVLWSHRMLSSSTPCHTPSELVHAQKHTQV